MKTQQWTPAIIVMALGWVMAAGVAITGTAESATAPAPATSTHTVVPELTPDEELLSRIKALPDNTWLKLPPLTTAGELAWCGAPDWPNTSVIPKRGPGVRDYSGKMVWAADRRRALYCGTNHQAPHFINDVWEYDLASNTWVCIYAPDPQYPLSWIPSTLPAELQDKLVEWGQQHTVMTDGVIRTPRGGPVRPPHTWAGLTYDSDRHRLLWFDPLTRGCNHTHKNTLARGLGLADEKELLAKWRPGAGARNTYLWSFDPFAGTWETLTEGIPAIGEGHAAEYIPDQQKVWVDSGTALYDPDTRTTVHLKPRGSTGGGYGVVAAYDPESRTIVMLIHNKTCIYSFATNAWRVAQDNAMASGSDAHSFFCYDLVAKKFILNTRDKGPLGRNKPGLYLYDLAANQWTEARPGGDPVVFGGAGYYDPERNVTVMYSGSAMYVYRSKKAAN